VELSIREKADGVQRKEAWFRDYGRDEGMGINKKRLIGEMRAFFAAFQIEFQLANWSMGPTPFLSEGCDGRYCSSPTRQGGIPNRH
jgi:hypothetical protein